MHNNSSNFVVSGRRIHCFNPVDFPEPPAAIAEYCWRHGGFAKNDTETGDEAMNFLLEGHSNWILQSYMYYFIRAIIFFLPHILWNTNYRPWISAMVCGMEDMIKVSKLLSTCFEIVSVRTEFVFVDS